MICDNGCKWKLIDITNTYLLKDVGDPHRAGKLIMDSPHEAAVDSWHPHKIAIDLSKIVLPVYQICKKKVTITPSDFF